MPLAGGPTAIWGLTTRAEKTTHACCRAETRLGPLPGMGAACGQVCGGGQVTWSQMLLWASSMPASCQACAKASHPCDLLDPRPHGYLGATAGTPFPRALLEPSTPANPRAAGQAMYLEGILSEDKWFQREEGICSRLRSLGRPREPFGSCLRERTGGTRDGLGPPGCHPYLSAPGSPLQS